LAPLLKKLPSATQALASYPFLQELGRQQQVYRDLQLQVISSLDEFDVSKHVLQFESQRSRKFHQSRHFYVIT
jgi:hypothetical protein